MNDDFFREIKDGYDRYEHKLAVLICTVPDRRELFDHLLQRFSVITPDGIRNHIQFLCNSADKSVSVGAKRQKLLNRSRAQWVVFFDDDDWPEDQYISSIINAIEQNPDIDCIGIRGYMTTNGTNRKTWCHRLGFEIKGDGTTPTESGYDYMRPIIHFNPVKRELALKAGFRDMRYGEDMDYASRLNPLLTKEYFIDQDLFHYRYSTAVPHQEKYGITK
jgi:hypothetical protein